MANEIIRDKQGRSIAIDQMPPGWKITPRQRDQIYQQFLQLFPDRNCTSEHAWTWMRLKAQEVGISPKRVRDFIGEALASEQGILDPSWQCWVGCSL